MDQLHQMVDYVHHRPELVQSQQVDMEAINRACQTANAIVALFSGGSGVNNGPPVPGLQTQPGGPKQARAMEHPGHAMPALYPPVASTPRPSGGAGAPPARFPGMMKSQLLLFVC